ncbi:ALP1-like protein [Tanacetum coccineum]
MDPNQNDDERNNFSEIDDETDMWFMMQAYEYNQRLEEEQNQPRLTHNPINRDLEDAERRLIADYFDDYSLIVCIGNGKIVKDHDKDNTVAGANNDINVLDNSLLFDDLLDIAPVAPFVVNGVGFEKGYYLANVIYYSGELSSNHSRSQMARNIVFLKDGKKVHERTSNVLLVFSKDIGE